MIYNKENNTYLYTDPKYKFIETFNINTGYYERSGILKNENV